MEAFAESWFILYYFLLGMLVLFSGLYLLLNYERAKTYLLDKSNESRPPALLRMLLKYVLLFTLPCILLSFFPFSWIELLFSIWSLVIVFISGNRLVRWEQTRNLIKNNPGKMGFSLRMTGAIMVAVSLAIFSLGYLKII
ncbi:MAG: hypothetical protein R3350_06670 [Saprospiraceae bacterium]|nr:hypothetical protein [Saprospiraceae bacterium]